MSEHGPVDSLHAMLMAQSTHRLGEIHRLEAEVAALRKDAERYRWLRDNITFHDIDHDWPVEAPNVPTLAQVSNRLWYHATDNVTDNTLDAAIDAALADKPKFTDGRGNSLDHLIEDKP